MKNDPELSIGVSWAVNVSCRFWKSKQQLPARGEDFRRESNSKPASRIAQVGNKFGVAPDRIGMSDVARVFLFGWRRACRELQRSRSYAPEVSINLRSCRVNQRCGGCRVIRGQSRGSSTSPSAGAVWHCAAYVERLGGNPV